MAFVQDPHLFDAAFAAYLDDDLPRYEAAELARSSVDRDFGEDLDHEAGVLGLSERDLHRKRYLQSQLSRRLSCSICGSRAHGASRHYRQEEEQ